jgi:HSP20 family molecular chaperone IbpA
MGHLTENKEGKVSPEKREDISKSLDEIEAALKNIEVRLGGKEKSEKTGPEVEGTGKGKGKGVAQGVVESLGEISPQLGKLLETLEGSPAFEDRLQEIDLEVESRFSSAGVSPGRITGSIPPGVRGRPGGPTVRRGTSQRVTRQKVKVGADTLKAVPADVFDEGDVLKVVAELPGYEAKEIKVKLEEGTLIIDASSARGKKRSRVELPCAVEEKLDTTFRNGVLQVLLKKK